VFWWRQRQRDACGVVEEHVMEKRLSAVLSDAEWLLVEGTETAHLRSLDEDELLALHERVRKARNKQMGLYRRTASRRVGEKGARGASHGANARARDKVEAFEAALARVSRAVATAAADSARTLKEERLAAARAGRSAGPSAELSGDGADGLTPSARRRATKTTGGIKKDASTRAKGAQRQAKRDAR
jgi:hypothetical protein